MKSLRLKTKQIIIPLVVICSAVLGLYIFKSCTSIKRLTVKQKEICNKKYEKQIRLAEEYLNSTGFSGTVLVAKKNKLLFVKGYGKSDLRNKNSPANNINTVYEAGSLSKQFTAAAVIQLINKKKLSYEDSINKFFPDFEQGKNITVRMLLTMRSGLTDCINASEDFFPKNIARQIEKKQLNNQPLEKDLVLKYLNEAPLMAKPDSTYFYSNTNYYLLAKIVEQVSGFSFEEYVHKNLFEPAGLLSANIRFQKTDARGYDSYGRYYSLPEELAFGSGDLNCSVLDLYKWQNQLVNKKIKGVGKKGFRQMLNREGGYGSGLFYAQDTMFHGGTTNVFNAYSGFNFKSKYHVIIISNKPISQFNASFAARKISTIFTQTK